MKNRQTKSALQNISVGLQMAVTVFIFVYAGYRLGMKFGMLPLFLLLGAFLGMGIGFYNLIRQLAYADKKKDEGKPEDEKPVKWL